MLACICVPPAAVRSLCGWPRDISPTWAQVTLSSLGAQNRVYTAWSEYDFPGSPGLAGLGCVFCTESALGAQEEATAGSADSLQQEPENIWRCSKTARWAPRENSKEGDEASAGGTSQPPPNKRPSSGMGARQVEKKPCQHPASADF